MRLVLCEMYASEVVLWNTNAPYNSLTLAPQCMHSPSMFRNAICIMNHTTPLFSHFSPLPPSTSLSHPSLSYLSLLFSFHQAILGQAVDRHLLGLKLLAAEAGMETPTIFNDVAYTRSLHFRISTSQVPMPEADPEFPGRGRPGRWSHMCDIG